MKKQTSMFPSTAYTARVTALKMHHKEVEAILPLVQKASESGELSVIVPKLHPAVKELLEIQHELTVRLIADYNTHPATLNHKISW